MPSESGVDESKPWLDGARSRLTSRDSRCPDAIEIGFGEPDRLSHMPLGSHKIARGDHAGRGRRGPPSRLPPVLAR